MCELQVDSLQAECNRLLNDKTSLHSQIAELREHYASLGMAPNLATGHMASVRASLEADSAKAEAFRQLQAAQLDNTNASKLWEQERQRLQVIVVGSLPHGAFSCMCYQAGPCSTLCIVCPHHQADIAFVTVRHHRCT